MAARLAQDWGLLVCSECGLDKFAVFFHVSFFEHFSLVSGLFVSTNHDVFGTIWRWAYVGVLSGRLVADAYIWSSEAVVAEEFWGKSG